jgi:small neutral amino acid transporter SnatA (MarC family)
MTDLSYAFTIYFVTLGPVKTIPVFYQATHDANRKTVIALATKSATVATAIALFVVLVASGVLVTWRVSVDAIAIAGGIVLFTASVKALSGFNVAVPNIESPTVGNGPESTSTSWTGRPVLSPLAIPAIVSPIGVVAILYFFGTAIGNTSLQAQLLLLLLGMMTANFVAMLLAGPIIRAVGVPMLQIVGWVLSALQAGLAVQIFISAVQNLR